MTTELRETHRDRSGPSAAGRHLTRALAGDRAAFSMLVGAHRAEIQLHCYRMLGSLHDAEDALQETLLRAWRSLPSYAGRAPFRAWLYKIATNVCLDSHRRRRRTPVDLQPPADPSVPSAPPAVEQAWIEPYPDGLIDLQGVRPENPAARYEQRESVRLAFIAAVQHLPARQRAALLLRDVLGFSARETAAMLDTSEAAANSALQRARARVEERIGPPEASGGPDPEERRLVERYMRAWESADVDGLVELLADDARLAMPPIPSWYDGAAAIGTFVREIVLGGPEPSRMRLLPTAANRRAAVAMYDLDRAAGEYRPLAIQVLEISAGEIADIDGFVDPAVFRAFGLPSALPA